MNMLTAIPEAAVTNTRALRFFDEEGNPSERCGPDLTKAEPIDKVIKRLAPMRNGYAVAFVNACKESGVDVSVTRTKEGEDRLSLGVPLDCQEQLRRPRYDALVAQMKRGKRRRGDVIDLINAIDWFADNQPYGSIAEAAKAYIAAGGRIMVDTEGNCEETIPFDEERFRAEGWNGFQLRRLAQRYDATFRMRGGRAAMAAFVVQNGKFHPGSGWTMLKMESDQ